MLLESLLEEAHLVNPKSYFLWTEAVKIEEHSDSGAPAQGKALLARAPQECPTSNILWSMEIWSEAGTQRKARSVDALRWSLLLCIEHPVE
jgi:pre-mRNA-processing factor 6